MRITREALLKLAHDAADQRVRANRGMICIYLTGSLLGTNPLLGGTADIDLVCIHDSEPPVPREVIRLTEDIHLDIGHYPQDLFRQPRHLRVDPWVGAYLVENPLQLHDTQHWFEFNQASVSAQFYEPENVIQRVRPLAEAARRAWLELQANLPEAGPQALKSYLWALERAANAIACITGPALTERRFLLNFPQRAEALGRPGLAAGLVDLLAPALPSNENWESWQPDWQAALLAAGKAFQSPPRLSAPRRLYYERGAAALWANPRQRLYGSTAHLDTGRLLVERRARVYSGLRMSRQLLGLDVENFAARLDSLDAYLDNVEETLDTWAQKNGL